MTSIKGLLRTLLGLDASGVPCAVGVDEDGYIRVSLPGQAGSGSKVNPLGKLISPVGISPTGVLKNFQVDANGNLIITLSGGNANEIVKSDGTDAEWDTLANVIEAAILTADGDILIRSGGVAQRLAKPDVGQILGESSQIPAWIAKPSGGYTEGSRVYHDVVQSISSGSSIAVLFNSENYDTDDIHSLVTDTSHLTCKTPGKYDAKANVLWAFNTIGVRVVRIRLNGDTNIAVEFKQAVTSSPWATGNFVSTTYDLSIGDYLECIVYQTSGISINLLSQGVEAPVFSMERVG